MAEIVRPAAAHPAPPIAQWIVPVLIGWVVPGGGHFYLKRTGRAAMILACVVLMFLIGLMLRGPLFEPQSGDMLTMVIYYGGFFSHIATGALYFITVALGYNQPDVAGHVHDYGAKFLVGAGMLNILAMVDAYEIATGKKS